MLYPPDMVSKIVKEMEKEENQRYGSATVKLRKWDEGWGGETEVLDSCGIAVIKPTSFMTSVVTKLTKDSMMK
jgi:hypothetical protein